MFYRTIVPPFAGVNAKGRRGTISDQAFVSLQQLRIFQNVIQNFPGWTSLIASQSTGVGAFGTLIDELVHYDGSRFLIVGGPSKIYIYNAVTKSLTDISGILVFNATRDEPWWSFFFNDFLYLTNLNDGLYKINGGDLAGVPDAPRGRVGGVLLNHICLLNTIDGTGAHPQRFQWAAEGTDNDWVATAQNDAGGFDLLDQSTPGIGLLPLANDLVGYMERAIIPFTFIGGNEVFGRRTTISGIGPLGQYAIVDIGDEHLFFGPDQPYSYNGGQEPDATIGIAIRDAVYPNLHKVYRNRMRSLFIEATREAMFVYPSLASTGENDTCVIFNIEDQVWYGPFPISCSMLGTVTKGQTIVVEDVLDIVDTVDVIVDDYPDITQATYENLFIDGHGDLMGINDVSDVDGQSANGAPITRVLETGDQAIAVGAVTQQGLPASLPLGAVLMVTEVNTEIGDLSTVGTFELYLRYKMELDDPPSYYGPIMINQRSHHITTPVRATGRWFGLKIVIPNSQQFQLTGYQYVFNVAGRR